jgi:hypothetical protein
MNPAVTQLSLYDVANVKGVAADVSHINSRAKVEVSGLLLLLSCCASSSKRLRGLAVLQGFEGDAELEAALKGCDVVIIPAGVPRKPGMTRDDLFKVRIHSSADDHWADFSNGVHVEPLLRWQISLVATENGTAGRYIAN